MTKLQAELRERDKEIEKLKAQIASGGGRDPLSAREQVGELFLLVHDAGVADPKILRESADKLRPRMEPGVLVLAGVAEGKMSHRLRCHARRAGQAPGRRDRRHAGQGSRRQGRRPAPTWRKAEAPCPPARSLAEVIERWTAKLREHAGE